MVTWPMGKTGRAPGRLIWYRDNSCAKTICASDNPVVPGDRDAVVAHPIERCGRHHTSARRTLAPRGVRRDVGQLEQRALFLRRNRRENPQQFGRLDR